DELAGGDPLQEPVPQLPRQRDVTRVGLAPPPDVARLRRPRPRPRPRPRKPRPRPRKVSMRDSGVASSGGPRKWGAVDVADDAAGGDARGLARRQAAEVAGARAQLRRLTRGAVEGWVGAGGLRVRRGWRVEGGGRGAPHGDAGRRLRRQDQRL